MRIAATQTTSRAATVAIAVLLIACGSPTNNGEDATLDTLLPAPVRTGELQDPVPDNAVSTSVASAGPVPALGAASTLTSWMPTGPRPVRPAATEAPAGTGATGDTDPPSGTDAPAGTDAPPSTADTGTTTTTTAGGATTTTAALKDQAITITTDLSGPWAYGESRTIVATADSGLPVELAAHGACTVRSQPLGILAATDVGTCEITLSQDGGGGWRPAPEVTRVMAISKATPVISGFADRSIEYPQAALAIPLSATVSAGAAAKYRTPPGQFCSVVGDELLVPLAGGTVLPQACVVEAYVDASSRFEAASVTAQFTIEPTDVRITGHTVDAASATELTITATLNRAWGITIVATCAAGPIGLSGAATYTFTITYATVGSTACDITVTTVVLDGSHTNDWRVITIP
jgi:hypothetical protein